jgi:LysM repeat protein
MHTIKSACLVVVLLGVLYGVYVALNKPDVAPQPSPAGREEPPPLNIEYGSGASPSVSLPSSAPRLAGTTLDTPSPAVITDRAVRGGAYEPSTDASPNTPPSGLQRSAYEAPITSPAAESRSNSGAAQSPETAPPLSPLAPSTDPSPALAAYDLKRDLADAEQLIAGGKFKAALARLSAHCASDDLPSDERTILFGWLDALAAKVIYSPEHLLAPPHQVRQGEDLYKIAQQYNVEYRLLQSINHREVRDPLVLVPATELKVVPGPFRADVSLATSEMMLFVGDCYAGRFSFALGDQPPQPGEYKIIDKRSQQKTYVGFDGRLIPANDPGNPYGGWWISLGGEVAIHGSPLTPGAKTLGCISLSPQDAKDVYGILSIGNDVRIRP